MTPPHKTSWKEGDAGVLRWMNTVSQHLNDACDIRDYGASVDANDNSTALQDALDDAAARGLRCFLAPGTYRYATPLTTKAGLSGIHGDGTLNYRGSGGWALTIGNPAYGEPGESSATRNIHCWNFAVDGSGSQNAAGGVRFIGMGRSSLNALAVHNFATGVGLQLEYGWINAFRDLIVASCQTAVRAYSSGRNIWDQSFNASYFTGGELGAGCDYGVIIGDETREANPDPTVGSGAAFRDVCIEGVRKVGLWVVDGIGIAIDHCYFERCGWVSNPSYPLNYVRAAIHVGTDTLRPTALQVTNSLFAGNINSHVDDPAAAIQIERVYRANIAHNSFTHGIAGRGVVGVKLVSGSCDNVLLVDNYANGAVAT